MPNKKREKDFFDYINPFTRKYVKPGIDWFLRSRIHMALVVIGIIFLVVFASLIKQTLIISLLILLGGISKIYQRYFRAQVGIEFIMLATVVTGFVYGSIVGGIVGFVTFSLATYFSGRFSHSLFPSFIMVTIVGMVSPLFNSVAVAGIVLTIIYDILLAYIYIAWFRGRIHRVLLFTLTHFFWNLYVFTKIAPSLARTLLT